MEGLGGGGRMGTGDVNSLLADEEEEGCRSRPAGSLWDEKKRGIDWRCVGVVITTLNKV